MIIHKIILHMRWEKFQVLLENLSKVIWTTQLLNLNWPEYELLGNTSHSSSPLPSTMSGDLESVLVWLAGRLEASLDLSAEDWGVSLWLLLLLLFESSSSRGNSTWTPPIQLIISWMEWMIMIQSGYWLGLINQNNQTKHFYFDQVD